MNFQRLFLLLFTFLRCFYNVLSSKEYTITVATPPIYLGEGPHWDVASQSLYFVDILGQNIFKQDYKTGSITQAHLNYGPVGAVIPVQNRIDQLLVACDKDILLVTWDGKRNVTDPPFKKLATLESPERHTRVNDGKCDGSGRFWIGTMALEENGVIEPNQGSLYSFDSQSKLTQIFPCISISNGLAWNSKNNIMYYIDSLEQKIFSFDYDLQCGSTSNKQVVFDLPKYNFSGIPDGMTIDTDDNLWIVVHDNHSIIRVDPRNGDLLKVIELPARRVTSVAFGGPNLDVLFVTSAYHGVDNAERKQKPYSGCVFAIKGLGVKGHPANNFIYKQ